MKILSFFSKSNHRRQGKFAKRIKKTSAKYGLPALHVMAVVGIALFLVNGKKTAVSVASLDSIKVQTNEVTVLDQVSSADIAVNIALAARLPEMDQVRNQADSRTTLTVAPVSDDVVVSKPQIVTEVTSGSQSRKDIGEYVAADGESVASIAEKFTVSADALRWSNGISGSNVATGTKMVIPPKNRTGLVYKPNSTDTIQALADKYKTTVDKIISFNDLEITKKLPIDEYIFIPDGEKPPEPKAIVQYATQSFTTSTFVAQFGSNGYAAGYCTWWVADQRLAQGRPLPSNLGNAISWVAAAQSAGFGTGSEPRSGAVVWFRFPATGYGHVAMVENVFPDGSFEISEMNGRAGWGRVDNYTIPGSQVGNYTFIY